MKTSPYLTCAVAIFGLFTAGYIAQSANQARAELAHTRAMLKGITCNIPVRSQPMPPVVVETLAQKNNNPLNIKRPANGGTWKGQVGTDKFGHAVFERIEYGVRAGALVLRSYARKHKVSTVEDLVRRFAEDNHDGYIKHLCAKLGVSPQEKLDLVKRMPELLRVMIRQESGQDLPDHFFAPYDIVVKL